jgi:glycosyltransferase involved in cell wall biosynthesis
MRPLWLIDSLTAGGAEALTAAVAGEARRRGWRLTVAFLKRLGDDGYEAAVRATGVPVVHLAARHLRDAAAYRRLARLLRAGGFDLVHAHLAYASIWGAVAAPRAGLPLVATLHVAPPRVPPLSREGLRQRLMRGLLARRAARVVAVSRALADTWIDAGLPAGRLEVVHNGIDVAAYEPAADGAVDVRRELALPAGAPVLATVTVLRAGKGSEVLLEAFAALRRDHPAAVLVVAGDGPLRPALEARAAELGLGGAVRWAGFRRDVPQLLAAADLFVLPSRWDAFPTAVLEAMAAGLPVVASHTGGIPEMVEDGVTGLLVPPGDAPALAAALSGLLAAATGRRAEMGRRGRERAGAHFSLAAWADRLEALYRAVAGGGGGAP